MPKNTFKLFNNFIEHLEPKYMTLVPFFKFFLGRKMTRRGAFFLALHYALVFYAFITPLNLLFFDLLCTRVEKIFRKWTKKMSKNRYIKTFLRKNARR